MKSRYLLVVIGTLHGYDYETSRVHSWEKKFKPIDNQKIKIETDFSHLEFKFCQ